MGASLALSGLGACARRPEERILPYVIPPEQLVPGRPLYFATAYTAGGYALGLLVESHMGRPIKVEGNPQHPASLGATDAAAQAWVLELWDPSRSRTVVREGRPSSWEEFAVIAARLGQELPAGGVGLRILTETVTSPTLAGQIRALLDRFPGARWHQYEAAGRDAARGGAQMAFGQYVEALYRLDEAAVILALDCDLFQAGPAGVRHAHDFAATRRAWSEPEVMSRLYVAEPMPTITGAIAEHRLPLRARDVERLARAVAGRLGLGDGGDPADLPAAWIERVVSDLEAAGSRAVVVAGLTQPPVVHALAHAINQALGSVGTTVLYTEPVEAEPVDQAGSLRALVEDMAAGDVSLLLMLGGNPAYAAPADVPFGQNMSRVGLSIHLSLYRDETSRLATWHLPQAHGLEAWSDGRAFDGAATIMQPLITPLYGGRSAHEVLSLILGDTEGSGYEAVRRRWLAGVAGDDVEGFWQTAVRSGIVPGSEAPLRQAVFQGPLPAWAVPAVQPEGLEIVFRPDPHLWDGRWANNHWLQELPRPLTKLAWDNAAFMGQETAVRLGVEAEDVVELRYRGRSVEAPVWILPGHAEGSVTVHLGYGRAAAGGIGTAVGFDAYALRTLEAPWFDHGLEVVPVGRRYPMATTQEHQNMRGWDYVHAGTWQAYRELAEAAGEGADEVPLAPSLYPEWPYPGPRWAMAIDLSTCVGCQACVVACQAENNIAVVGKDGVLQNREMHWLRIDAYRSGEEAGARVYFQPVPCMQCEKAPCELVCPVHATVHSADGLNDMTYNRCVGTRYCSNNCPYKVRRFNFYEYTEFNVPGARARWNPEVTARSLGVMEKCTYCVQRIRSAQIEAELEGRPLADGEIQTACQQACPTQAIVFGDMSDEGSLVARMKAHRLNYALLGELNTQPRTTYLAALRNPNPGIEGG
jgi:Fe-S-cluster-containing dehydrogenase component